MIAVLASIPQTALSAGTLAVALLVYLVQADKLFLDMRDRRLAALDRFRSAARSRWEGISRSRYEDGQNYHASEAHEAMMAEYWDAERDLSLWFGPEVEPIAKEVGAKLMDWEQEKIRYLGQFSGARTPGDYNAVSDAMMAADKTMGDLLDAAKPYVAAGRRGLPIQPS